MHPLLLGLSLDSTGVAGATEEVSEPFPMGSSNTVKVQILVYVQTATNVSVTVEGTSDGTNYDALGSAQTYGGLGRKLFTSVTDVAVAAVRVRFSITGTGQAILDSHIHTSEQ